jgi:tRNA dimethylallyltransferase
MARQDGRQFSSQEDGGVNLIHGRLFCYTDFEMPKPKLIAIVGPTASGKTSLSLELTRRHGAEIVSADSRQIYREMDIGTAKPSWDEMRAILHHLIDIKNPNEDYTVSDYQRDAQAAIADIARRGKLPVLVGGTGLYVRAVLENLDIPRAAADPALRARIERDIAELGLAAVFAQLVARDPEAAYIVDPRNPRRVVRALEVAITTGEPFTAQRRQSPALYDVLKLGLATNLWPPEILRERIDRRIDVMMQDGLVEEVENLVKKYGRACVAFDAIGYREIIDYLNGKISLERAVANMKLNTWRYAKRQMTWFRKDKEVQWIENLEEAEKLLKEFLKP